MIAGTEGAATTLNPALGADLHKWMDVTTRTATKETYSLAGVRLIPGKMFAAFSSSRWQ
jgi:hypothetical protein